MVIQAYDVPAAACQELMNLEWGKFLRRDDGTDTKCEDIPTKNGFQTFSIIMD